MMRDYQMHAKMIGAALVLIVGSSASEAGWLRGRSTCYYYPADSTSYSAPSPAPSVVPSAAPTQTVVPTPSGAVVHQTNKPAISVEPRPAATSAATNYAPRYALSTMSGGGWSVLPRSSSDFGSFPPYR